MRIKYVWFKLDDIALILCPRIFIIARKRVETSKRFETAASSSVDKKQLRFLSTDCFLSTDEEAAASKRMEVSTLFRAIMNIY